MKILFVFATAILLCVGHSVSAQWRKITPPTTPYSRFDFSERLLSYGDTAAVCNTYIAFRFDGLQWALIWDSENDSLFTSSAIADFTNSPDGTWWFATSNGVFNISSNSVVRYDWKRWAFDSTKQPTAEFQGSVDYIRTDSKGRAWAAGLYSNATAIAMIDGNNVTVFPCPKGADGQEEIANYSPPSPGISHNFMMDSRDNLWFATYNGIVRFSTKQGAWKLWDTIIDGAERIPLQGYLKSFIETPDGIIRIATGLTLLEYRPDDTWRAISTIGKFADRKDTLSILQMAVIPGTNDVWATMPYYYLSRISSVKPLWAVIELPPGVGAPKIKMQFQLFSGLCVYHNRVWFGTLQDGIMEYDPEASGVSEVGGLNDALAHTWIFSTAPNPMRQSAVAQIFADPAMLASLQVGLYSMQGIMVRNLTAATHLDTATGRGAVELDAAGLATGVYLLRVANGADNFCSMITVMQ